VIASQDYNAAIDAHSAAVRNARTEEVRYGPWQKIAAAMAVIICLPGDWCHLHSVSLRRVAGHLLRLCGPSTMALALGLWVLALPLAVIALPFRLVRALLFAIARALPAVARRRRFVEWPAFAANAEVDAVVLSHRIRAHYAADLIIVPGYAEHAFAGALTQRGAERLQIAASDFFCGRAPFILVSGGNVRPQGTSFNEAFEMRRYLTDELSVPKERVIVEPLAEHTPTNLRNAGRYMRARSMKKAIVVSDPEPFGQSIMLQAPHSLIFGVILRAMWTYEFSLGTLRRIDDARTEFLPSEEVMLVGRAKREP
jgi:uncharacterized SAM-binding protein YcdF (DUF218 family)